MIKIGGPIGSGITYFLVATIAAVAGFFLYHVWHNYSSVESSIHPQRSPTHFSNEIIDNPRPEFSLTDLNGESVSIARWDGKVVLLNFWATWCPPCRKEIPAFIEVLKQYGNDGFQVIGVAIDETEAVKEFVTSLGANYPQLIGQQDAAEVSKRYGNQYGALPYSVLIDRKGFVRFIKPGELHKEMLEIELRKLL